MKKLQLELLITIITNWLRIPAAFTTLTLFCEYQHNIASGFYCACLLKQNDIKQIV